MMTRLLPVAAIMAACILCPVSNSRAQDAAEPRIHWAYSSFFGTGWYKISDLQSAFIVNAAPRWTVGEARLDDNGAREIAYTLRMPVTVGLARLDFEDIPGILDPGNFATASVGISLDADVPLTKRLAIRPSAEIGFGTVLGEPESAWTYRTEIRGRYELPARAFDWNAILAFGAAGYKPNDGASDDFVYAAAGIEFGLPVRKLSSRNRQTLLYWHLMYVDFVDEIEYATGFQEFDSVANYWQFGLALGRRDKPIRVWFLNFERLGLGYNYSATGELRGIKLLFRSLYEN